MRVRVRAQFSEASGVLSWMQSQNYKTVDKTMANMIVEAAKALRKRVKAGKHWNKQSKRRATTPEGKARLARYDAARKQAVAMGLSKAEYKQFLEPSI